MLALRSIATPTHASLLHALLDNGFAGRFDGTTATSREFRYVVYFNEPQAKRSVASLLRLKSANRVVV